MSFTLPELELTPKDYKLYGNVKTMVFNSYYAKKGLFGISKADEGSPFLDDSFMSLSFKNNYVVVKEVTNTMNNKTVQEHLYDANHNLTTINLQSDINISETLQPDGVTTFIVKNDSVIDVITHDRNGNLASRFAYFIDRHMVEEIWYDDSDGIRQRKEFILNDAGQIIKEIIYNIYKESTESGFALDGVPFGNFIKEDADLQQEPEDKNEPEEEFIDGEEYLESFITNSYDNNGFLVETQYFDADDNLAEKEVFRNDAFGNPLYQIHYEDDEVTQITMFTYKYDKHNNWTQRITHEVDSWKIDNIEQNKSTPKYIAERIFEYDK